MDECTGEKIAVTRVTLQVAREVIVGEEIRFRADVAGSGSDSRTDYGRGLVVDRVAIGRARKNICWSESARSWIGLMAAPALG